MFTLTRPCLIIMNTFRENIELENMKNVIHISLRKTTSKSTKKQSIKKILRAGTLKESLIKPKGNKSTVSVNKRKKETFRS